MEELKLPEPVKLTGERLICLQGCRSYKQYYEMRRRFEKDICTFCELPKENEIIWEDEHMRVWHVPLKYMREDELKYHFVIAPKRHVRRMEELTDDEAVSLHHAHQIIGAKYHMPGGGYVTRFGAIAYNAGTVDHLHVNIYVPSGDNEFRVPLMKSPEQREENRIRAAEFAARYDAGEVPETE
ncbi:MAG TPA: hypothetical protein VFS75_01225 [Candidatus Paceibacterota bacterium]|nr:hypothetical protein [Candidatus Paceibacterota bacterium]